MDKKTSGQKLIIIIGPTASGKSDLGIKLARKFNGEIISADSRQVYRGMDIGTGKVLRDRTFPVPNLKFKIQNSKFRDFYSGGIRHHLIDIASPKKQFTASDFKKLGEKAIKKIVSGGKTPIICGGTGFYIDILVGRMVTADVPPNKKIRVKLEKQSSEQLFKQLKRLDPRYSGIIDRHNKRRLIRALEIILATGKPIPSPTIGSKYKILWLGLAPKDLKERIEKRLNQRLKNGMIGEVKNLINHGVSHKHLETFGLEYGWISRYLRSLISKDEMKEKLYLDIVKYSKRQMTWFKKNEEIHWLNPNKSSAIKNAERLTRHFLY